MNPVKRLYIILFMLFALPATGIYGEVFVPAGYGQGENVEGTGWSLEMGLKDVEEDYYFFVTPIVHFPVYNIRFGLQLPLEFLIWDRDPAEDNTAVSLRDGMYDDTSDALRFINYIRYGTHNYYDPDDDFNFSFFIGSMTDGYIGHRTIVDRYVSSFDPTVHRLGFMGEINNQWGGVEVFASDVVRQEVTGGRVYVRPTGIAKSVINLVASNSFYSPRKQVAMARRENLNPDLNGGILFQERIPKPGTGGSLKQQFYEPLKQEPSVKSSLRKGNGNVSFEEVTDPETGKTTIKPTFVPPPDITPPPGQADRRGLRNQGGNTGGAPDSLAGSGGNQSSGAGGAGDAAGGVAGAGAGANGGSGGGAAGDEEYDEYNDPLTASFWSRFAIGYSYVKDGDAPLSLETDGSGNLVVDPDTNLPRGGDTETLTIQGYDMEMRLSPFRWLDVTPYVDLNKIVELEDSKGLHVGLDSAFKIGDFMLLKIRPEYREMSSNYLPVYFNAYYSIERTVYDMSGDSTNTQDTTKLSYLKNLDSNGELVKGYYVGIFMDWFQTLVIDLSYENYDGPDNSAIFVGFYVPTVFNIFINGYYMKRHYDKIDESFIVDDRSLLAAEAGISFFGGMYVKVTATRTWEVDDATGGYAPKDEISYGFGFSATL